MVEAAVQQPFFLTATPGLETEGACGQPSVRGCLRKVCDILEQRTDVHLMVTCLPQTPVLGTLFHFQPKGQLWTCQRWPEGCIWAKAEPLAAASQECPNPPE